MEQVRVAIDNFHSHLDGCEQCRDNPFGLCAAGAAYLKTVETTSRGILIAQMDDPELLEWLAKAERDGGGFIKRVAGAALRADAYNYPLIRPLVLQVRAKYPQYEPSDAVKAEIAARVKA
jgi:hypothetical protein